MTFYSGRYPPELWAVLCEAWSGGISLQSDFARNNAAALALAASCGFVTTVDADGSAYGLRWRVTQTGLVALSNKDLLHHA